MDSSANTKNAGSRGVNSAVGCSAEVELHQFVTYALGRIWIALICVFISLLVGYAYLRKAPQIFMASAMVEIPLKARQPIDVVDPDNQDFRSNDVLKTVERNLTRISLFRRVMACDEVKKCIDLQRWLENPFESYQPLELAAMLQDWTEVKLQQGTRLITVSVEHQSPVAAQVMANAIVDEFIRERVEMQSGTSASAFEFLLKEAEKARRKLENSEESLLNFHGFQQALVLKNKIEVQEDIILKMSQRYGDKHPKLAQERSKLGELNKQLHSQFDAAESIEALEEEISLLEGRFNALSREVEADRDLYEAIIDSLQRTDVSQNWDLIPLEIVDPAFAPLKPSKPKPAVVMAISGLLGGSIGISLLFILCLVDRSRMIDTAEQL